MTAKFLACGRFRIDLSHPRLMAILNVTEDSFSGDGLGADLRAACERARRCVEEGADLLDIGAESTRPGARPVSAAEEIARVIPAVEALRGAGVPLSVDTRHAEVMRAALAAGADMINDVAALRDPGAIQAVAASRAAVCLMHMRGEPATMQERPHYDDAVVEIGAFLRGRAQAAREAGIDADRILLDPGFGFGKRLEDNLALLKRLGRIADIGYPVAAGLSRKSMLGALTGRPVGERLAASVAAALIAAENGARVLRVHDVAATRDALAVREAVDSWGEDRG
ncbi:MAG TPA: dihydropteroate synthase [Rhodocyclaceae bacterium]|nr:MAG: dihydropteroate synthase [Betaproteobacteria bacterium CG2_30_68_42]PIV75900.1 MAG: dihydropteroate synthase [Rhodocyclales bacterium CG17_big_fil_post_rev_8_21_14_2_50_68_7]PJA58072.1 MAG: dihydropteroate synthase [Rhodocyclales bacterium CG_4_9_14_3_um_filter_68_10]HCX34524.1 dihydropteroate synthase [Rhodocyclaceae bacterium]